MQVMQLAVPAEQGAQEANVAVGSPPANQPLHRLRAARQAEGISRRTMAMRMNTEVDAIARQEQENQDLPLSTLHQWQAILNVPLSELLVDPQDALAPGVKRRAQMVRIMKTAKSLVEQAGKHRIRRTAQMLVDQLIDLMPELRDVLPWNEVGRRRTSEDVGSAFYRGLDFAAALGQLGQDCRSAGP